MKKKISITINNNVLKDIDAFVDNLYIRNRSQAIEHILEKVLKENKTAVILAGGDEENLKINGEFRFTKKIENEMVLAMSLKMLRKNNFKNIFLIGRQNLLTKAFSLFGEGGEYGVHITYVKEIASNGTFDTLKLIKGKISSKFLVVYDDLIFKRVDLNKIWDQHMSSQSTATLMLTTSKEQSKKGNVVVDGSHIIEFIQKPKKSDNYLVFSPIFVVDPDIFDFYGSSLEDDIFPELARKGLLTGYISPVREIHVHE